MKTTLQDIANKTGLSISTVSRVLRGEAKMDSENVELVIQTAHELNYQVNLRLLNSTYKLKKKLRLALITNFNQEEFYSSLFKGIANAASIENAYLALYDVTDLKGGLTDFLLFLSKHSIDGAIIFITDLSEKEYLKINSKLPRDFAVVSIAPVFHRVIDTVTFDSYMGGYLVGKHFEDKGYSDLGVIIGPTERHEALLRKSGFVDYVTHNSDMNLVWTFNGNYTPDSGIQAFNSYLKTEKKPRAVFCSNDYMAMGFMKGAAKAHVRIPEDLAIVGYDDLMVCRYLHPTLSSVHTDYEELGLAAINMINEKVASGEGQKGAFNLIPVSLTERQSS